MQSKKPAGLQKKNDSDAFGKKKLGKNVDAFIQREDQIAAALRHTKLSDHITNRAIWEDKQTKSVAVNQRTRRNKA